MPFFIIWAVAIGYVSVSARIQACPPLRNTRDTHVPPSGCARRLMAKLRLIEIPECPFANLPEVRGGRWGEGLTADKMKECEWVRPELVAEVEFLERTPDGARGKPLRRASMAG